MTSTTSLTVSTQRDLRKENLKLLAEPFDKGESPQLFDSENLVR